MMTRHHKDPLRAEDRILWNRVARTAAPLPGRTLEPDPVPVPPPADTPSRAAPAQMKPPSPQAAVVAPAAPPKPGFDPPTRSKLAKGRLPIEASVDLHGLTQPEAHALLLRFLHQAREAGLRHVLVVTGKGASLGSDGVLRRAVPEWIATGPFRALVSAHAPAARNHGGDGALYLKLRRALRP